MQGFGNISSTDFASALRVAIATSGMSLAQIVDLLAERNIKVTQAALSYWQSGRSLPRRQHSRQALVELEDIFGLAEGTLTTPLHRQLITLNPTTSLTPSPAPSSAPDSGFSSSTIDWSHEVYRETISVRIFLSPDRHSLTEKVTTLVRVPDVAHPTFHIGYHWIESQDDATNLTDIEGVSLGESISLENKTKISCLYTPDFVRPGDLHIISYTLTTRSSQPIQHTTERWFAWPIHYYSAFLDFGTNEPHSIEWVQAYTEEKNNMTQRIENIRPLTLLNSAVQVAAANVDGGSSVIRWQW